VSLFRKNRTIEAADVIAAAAGSLIGIAIGYIAAGSVGRVNRKRLKRAMGAFTIRTETPKRWTEDEAERLEAKVLDALGQDVVLARRAIRVSVLGMGLVELTGTVLHTAEIGLASDIVQKVGGVETVLNHLVVEGPSRAGVPSTGPNAPRAARG
jgi:hypothetical protein